MSTQAEINRQVCDLLADVIFHLNLNPDAVLTKSLDKALARLDVTVDALEEEND